MVELYWAEISAVDERGLGYPLSQYRAEKLERLRPPAARRRCIGAELLLIRALQLHGAEPALPLTISCDQNGKPEWVNGSCRFNLSHSGNYAACVLSDDPVGVDIQILTPWRPAVVDCCFSPEEQRYLHTCENRDAGFSELWCRKESFLKATGLGLRLPLNSFSCVPGGERAEYGGIRYAICSLRFPSFYAAVCCPEGKSEELTVRELHI